MLVAACNPGPTASPLTTLEPTAGAPTPSPGGSGVVSPGPSTDGAALRIYLVLGFGGQTGLVPVVRPATDGGAGPEAAIRALLRGPIDAESSARPAVYTAIPNGVELRELVIEGGVAQADQTGAFEAATEDGLPTAMRVAQVVFTLTHDPVVESVRLRIDGALVTSIGPDGYPQDRPFTRADFTDQLPPLFVDQPAWGATIASPVRVAGLANAFEATFQVRIAEAEDRALAAGAVTASCGTGCWGDFDVEVPFSIQASGPGVLQVFELSPRDGARQNLREYPLALVP